MYFTIIDNIHDSDVLTCSPYLFLPSPARAKLKLYRALAMVLLSLGRIKNNKIIKNKLVPLRKCLYISIIYQPFLLKFGMIILLGERIMSRDITATLQYCSIPCSAAEFIISLYVSHFSSY